MDEVPRKMFFLFIFPHLAKWIQGSTCEPKCFITSFPVIQMSLLETGVGFLSEVRIHEPFQMPSVWFCEFCFCCHGCFCFYLPGIQKSFQALPLPQMFNTQPHMLHSHQELCITQNHRRSGNRFGRFGH